MRLCPKVAHSGMNWDTKLCESGGTNFSLSHAQARHTPTLAANSLVFFLVTCRRAQGLQCVLGAGLLTPLLLVEKCCKRSQKSCASAEVAKWRENRRSDRRWVRVGQENHKMPANETKNSTSSVFILFASLSARLMRILSPFNTRECTDCSV